MKATGSTTAARARVVRWPRRPDVAQIVLADHGMVPTADDVDTWLREATDRGATAARTNALFPPAAEVFAGAGFAPIDTLALLELDLESVPQLTGSSTRRLRSAALPAAAEIDRQAFGEEWANDTGSLAEVRSATPHHRSRAVHVDGRLVAFSISGRAGTTGYIQRLAVHPDTRRNGHARALVGDALEWMRRRSATKVLVNTAVHNEAAITLYESFGFRPREERIVIMECALPAPNR